ncbi:hypothetical protein B0H15DRAFT_32788 [Mycena belliarum]|uniref:Uncharacterized protein n=1 Tax=Mycena belliarum TaxID=1033014 RepID=A0AAD6XR11_9AGAR|nr:hypothetical protein B0H15DRAFT_32788 [Mycena belliae]
MLALSRLAASAVLLAALAVRAADNLTCAGTGMNWYTDMVGETPCQTYQQLRRTCNAGYSVGVQSTSTPPDTCSDQLSACCCNTVSFALSMLCLNCQQNIGTSSGIDAGTGAYGIYLNNGRTTTCPNPQTHKLPNDIQKAVCNQKIKIPDTLYNNGWGDGAWFYVFTRDTVIKDNIVANNNSFTQCASTTLPSSASGSLPRSSSAPGSRTSAGAAASGSVVVGSSKSALGGGAYAGIAIGALALLGAAGAAFWFCRRRRHRQHAGVLAAGKGVFGDGGGRETGVVDDALVAHGESSFGPSSFFLFARCCRQWAGRHGRGAWVR